MELLIEILFLIVGVILMIVGYTQGILWLFIVGCILAGIGVIWIEVDDDNGISLNPFSS